MSHGQVLHVSCFQVHNMAQQSIDCKHVHVQSIQYFFSFHPLTGSHPADMADPVEPTLLDLGTRSSIGKSHTFK